MPRPARPGAHEALLDAARDEFSRRGVERARVEDIARRAGVSKGAFYLHFRTKEEAFREILQRFLGALHDHALRRQEVEDRMAREPGGDGRSLARHIEAECAIDVDLLELLWRNRKIVAAVDGAGVGANDALMGDFRRRMRAFVARRVVQRQDAGMLRADLDPEVVADVVLDSHEGLARRMVDMKAKPDLAAWARSFLVLLHEGMVVRGVGRTRAPPARAGARRASPGPD
ncbi:MAG TPA: helix-turn-helix domain-containing protein [Anaeromyxobacter sp.]|nr:helix-turn-helix domain-containing protein [Anaeromyxobacter sp.]